ncbi:phosphonate metabolism transcriptional regulator PhnF [Thalassospira alkalitolerans]|nr:phosphonate metabolism transcriptional regulator PhnF [Thalassospira alkalitolerans]|tara:strand:- start:8231 stop:8944 length:714 start_codon:yes stop_codon:yes gene_type:complete
MDWEPGLSIWKQIEKLLLSDIADGVFAPGDKMPTEMELVRRFGVNRHTVRRAMAALVDANVVRVEQGRGAFVQEQILDYPLGSKTRFSQIVSGRHRLPDKRLISSEILKANANIAQFLDVKPGTRVIELFSVSEADGIPLAVATSYLPVARFEGIVEIFTQTKSLTEAFKHFGIDDYSRKTTRISAQLPSSRVASLLKQAKNRPVISTESVDVDASGVPIEYGITAFSSDRVQLIVE